MPLVTVHCAGLSEGGLEDQLLWNGSRAGEVRAGKFEQAHGGTLFFKDVGEISPASQINLLRALEEKPVVSAAGARLVPADFRILAATHRDLGQMVEDGTFRLDLLYRFNVLSIELPLLRDRPQDIPLLAQFFLRRKAQQLNRPASHFSPDALFRMQEYDWPGNVRELENAVERAVVVQLGETLQADDLPLPEADLQPLPSLAEVEHRHIERVLQATEGNVSRAARVLGIDRVTLYSKIRKFNIPRP